MQKSTMGFPFLQMEMMEEEQELSNYPINMVSNRFPFNQELTLKNQVLGLFYPTRMVLRLFQLSYLMTGISNHQQLKQLDKKVFSSLNYLS
jgi:hypothetical protein